MTNDQSSLEDRLLDLLDRVREAGDETARHELNTLLRETDEARKLMPRILVTEQALVSELRDEEIAELLVPTRTRRAVPLRSVGSLTSWRSLGSAAAGILIGVLGASLVWAFVSPPSRRIAFRLANQNFEYSKELPQTSIWTRPDEWYGEDIRIVAAGDGLPEPKSGRHMLRLGPMSKNASGQAALMVRLDEKRPFSKSGLQLEISAWFHASVAGQQEHYTLRAATFAEEPEQVGLATSSRAVSRDDWRSLQDEAISLTGLGITCEPDQRGWRRVRIRLDVPTEARTLLIRLLANTPGPAQQRTPHYVDDLHAAWIIP